MLRSVDLELLVHGDHYPAVIDRVLDAQRSVWIATANLKELMIEDRRLVPGRRRGRTQYRSVLAALAELSAQGVELRILHAAPPSRVFRRDFDRLKGLVNGGLEMRLCPRTHLKLVIVDGRHLYLGSANWTGAGLGAKHDHRRNFELGLLTQDERLLDAAQELYERVWRGGECADCRMRDTCPMPLAAFDLSPPPAAPSSKPKRPKRARKSAAKRAAKQKTASRVDAQVVPLEAALETKPARPKRAHKTKPAKRGKSKASVDAVSGSS
ncbi:MAG TPA: phospholipase D family protein [Polyangiales bacterium]|nr:phospholipase D family protein [Polyangiales bacterium]